MSQLLLDLDPASPPSFDNFVVGDNAEALAAIRRLTEGGSDAAQRFLYLWGERGSGRSHLLAAACTACGGSAVDGSEADAVTIGTAVDAVFDAADRGGSTAPRLVTVDDVGLLDAAAQEALFHAINRLREDPRGALIVAGDVAPRDLAFTASRDDLRSRLAWGLVYRLASLDDDAKDAALVSHANRRGFPLPPDVRRYLLTHFARDLGSLMRAVDALDRHAREQRRVVTVPLIRDFLKRDADRATEASDVPAASQAA